MLKDITFNLKCKCIFHSFELAEYVKQHFNMINIRPPYNNGRYNAICPGMSIGYC